MNILIYLNIHVLKFLKVVINLSNGWVIVNAYTNIFTFFLQIFNLV